MVREALPEREREKMKREHAVLRYECRATRHWMARQDSAPADWSMPNSDLWRMAKYLLHFHCQRCGMWRHDAIDTVGDLLARKYDPPEWYGMTEDEERPTTLDLRLWQVQQIMDRERERKAAMRAKARAKANAKVAA
jgi:hypothetical protein